MNDIRFKYYAPVVVGTPRVEQPTIPNHENNDSTTSFGNILKKHMDKPESVVFSKHATKRVEERNIHISDESLARLNEGMRMASEKNLHDALILVDQTAFVVNVPSNTVITTKDQNDMKSTVFTNINGTVII